MLDLIKSYAALYFVEILGICIMGNHFHILVKTVPEYKFTDQDIKKRYVDFYGDDRVFTDGLIPSLRAKLSSLSEFVREIKVGFARYYNKRHNRLRRYLRYVYEAGAVNRPEKGKTPEKYAPLSQVNFTGQAKVIGDRMLN